MGSTTAAAEGSSSRRWATPASDEQQRREDEEHDADIFSPVPVRRSASSTTPPLRAPRPPPRDPSPQPLSDLLSTCSWTSLPPVGSPCCVMVQPCCHASSSRRNQFLGCRQELEDGRGRGAVQMYPR